ncbi:MAG: hypothetical protein WCH39_15720 [Schlesneria sp.]
MQVKLIKDCTGPNPAFDPKKPVDQATNWPTVPKPAGTVITDPDAHYLMYGDDPNAVAVDAEAQAKFIAYQKTRAAGLAARKAGLNTADGTASDATEDQAGKSL